MLKNKWKIIKKLKAFKVKLRKYNDFEYMKNTREEARKILEEKLQDIYKRLEELKAGLEKKAKYVKTEWTKFTDLLNNLKTEIYKDFEDVNNFVHRKLDEHEN